MASYLGIQYWSKSAAAGEGRLSLLMVENKDGPENGKCGKLIFMEDFDEQVKKIRQERL